MIISKPLVIIRDFISMWEKYREWFLMVEGMKAMVLLFVEVEVSRL